MYQHTNPSDSRLYNAGLSRHPSFVAEGDPEIRFYLTRLDGSHVPMIPVDELPPSVRIENVPRVISFQQTEKMRCVGSAAFTGRTFRLEQDKSTSFQPPGKQKELQPISGARSTQTRGWPKSIPAEPAPFGGPNRNSFAVPVQPGQLGQFGQLGQLGKLNQPEQLGQLNQPEQLGQIKQPDELDQLGQPGQLGQLGQFGPIGQPGRLGQSNKLNQPNQPSPEPAAPRQRTRGQRIPHKPRHNAGNAADPKVYCSYWIQHGNCAFKLQGCKYKHVMPNKVELKKIGFTSYPRWWLDATGYLEGQQEPEDHEADKKSAPNVKESPVDPWASSDDNETIGRKHTQKKVQTETGKDRAKPTTPEPWADIPSLNSSPGLSISLIDFSPSPTRASSSTKGAMHSFSSGYDQKQ